MRLKTVIVYQNGIIYMECNSFCDLFLLISYYDMTAALHRLPV